MLERLTRRLIGALRARLPDLGLEHVQDPRRRLESARWSLPHVLRATLVGLVAGCRSLADLESFTSATSRAARKALGLRGRLPDTTTRDLLVRLEPSDLRAARVNQVRQAHRRKALEPDGLPFGVVSMDGKATAIDAWDDAYAQRQRHGGSATGTCGLVRTITSCLISSRARVGLDAAPIFGLIP